MLSIRHVIRLFVLSGLICQAQLANAWGERGHQTVTIVAVRLVEARLAAKDPEFVRILRQKEQMLAHLSNVPDIVWRGLPRELAQINAPTHYLDLEFILGDLSPSRLSDLPRTLESYFEAIQNTCEQSPKNCAPGENLGEQIDKTGHASFRAVQLLDLMEKSLAELFAGQEAGLADAKFVVEAVDQALLYGGLASHFIGDLGNPMHTTKNFDGQLTGQRGLHSYFETQVVAAYPLDLNSIVFAYAQRARPFEQIRRRLKARDRLDMTWALTVDSFLQLDRLLRLDERHSLITRGDQFLAATRREPASVQKHYRQLVVERLATAADTLAELWIDVWLESGRPDLSGYRSFAYPVEPEFIPPTYLSSLDQILQNQSAKKPATEPEGP